MVMFISITISYLALRFILEELANRRIKNSKTRYTLKKALQIIYVFSIAVIIVTVWVENPQTLLVAYGVIGAGIAFSLQDLFKNFVGGIVILTRSIYSVGDRVEVMGRFGDVIDIDILYTTVLELRGWVEGDQATGRLTMIPNGKIINDAIQNYTKDHSFIWDEITIPVPYKSNWKKAMALFKELVETDTAEMTETASREVERIGEKYYLPKRDVAPNVYLVLTDNWVELGIRYVTHVKRRRATRHHLMTKIYEIIEANDDLEVASATSEITGFPDLNVKNVK